MASSIIVFLNIKKNDMIDPAPPIIVVSLPRWNR